MAPKKQSAHGEVGAQVDRAGRLKPTGQNKKVFRCGVRHVSAVRRELQRKGLSLHDTTGQTQRETLLRILQHVGPRGINTPEGVGLGFYRIATRVQELEAAGWIISSQRERLIGADGLVHVGIARYVLVGRRAGATDLQGCLDLGDAA